MAHPARLIRERTQVLHPGAVVEARGDSWIRHDSGGLKILDSSLEPLHIAGTTTEIDTAWVTSTDAAWQYMMVLADYNAYARNVLNAGDTIKYIHPASGEYVVFQPLSLNWVNQVNSRQQIATTQSVVATIADDKLLWTAGYGTGRHFSWQAFAGRIVKLLTIDSAANLPAATVTGTVNLELEFIIKLSAGIDPYLDGVQWSRSTTRVRTANRIEFRNAAGAVLWYLDFPRAWDANNHATTGQYEMRRQGGNYYITVRIPKTWVDAAAFPIHIDPTIDPTIANGNDDVAYDDNGFDIANGYPTMGYAGTVNCINAMRFAVSGLSGATAVTTYLNDFSNANGSTPTTNLAIYCERAAAPAQITSLTDLNGRTRTTAKADWDMAWTAYGTHDSSSMNAPVQEIMDNYNPTYLGVFVQNDGGTQSVQVYSYEGGYPPNLHIEYTTGASPVTVTLNAAALTASPQAVTVVPGAVSVVLNAATLSAAPQALLVDAPPGPVTVTLNVATLTAAAQALTEVPGAVIVGLNAAAGTLMPQALVAVPGAVVINLAAATLVAAPQAVSVSIVENVVVALNVATIAAQPQAVVTVPGAVVIPLAGATLVAQAQALTVSAPPPGSVVVSLNVATLVASPGQLNAAPGPATVVLNGAVLSAGAQPVSVFAPPNVVVSLNAATLEAQAQAAGVVPGEALVQLGAAAVTAAPQSVGIVPGPVVVTINAANLVAGPQRVTTYTLFGIAVLITIASHPYQIQSTLRIRHVDGTIEERQIVIEI